MRRIITVLAVIVGVTVYASNHLPLNEGVTNLSFLSQFEKDVVTELNILRTSPLSYVKHLQQRRSYYQGKIIRRPGKISIMTHEGVKAVDEAISYIKSRSKLGSMKVSRGMSLAAKKYAKYQGRTGATGHYSGGTTPASRVNQYGSWLYTIGENIYYGWNTGRDVILALLIDDGVLSRGHRVNMFNRVFNVVGIGCSMHRRYRYTCVMDHAGGFKEQ